MKGLLVLLVFIALAMVSWGVYGPVLCVGQEHMQGICPVLRSFASAWPIS